MADRTATEVKEASEEIAQLALGDAEHLIAAMTDGFSVLDADGVHVLVNPALCTMTGFSRDELIGVGPPHPYWPPEELPAIASVLQRALAGEQTSFELTFMRKDGTRFPVALNPSVLRDESGRVVRSLATVRDISQIMRAENALRASDERHRLLLQNASDAIYVHEVTAQGPGRIIEVNDQACEMLGYTRQELLKMGIRTADTPEQKARTAEAMLRLRTDGHARFETQDIAKDGRHIPVEVSASLFELSGVPTVLSVVRDRSECKEAEAALRASEERYATVADFTWAWEYWLTPGLAWSYCSPSCERISGYKAEAFIADPGLLERIVHPDDRALFHRHVADRAGQSDNGRLLEFRITTKNGETRWIGHECRRVFGRDGEFLGVRASNRDITEQREAFDRLLESERRYRGVVENAAEGIWIGDHEERTVWVNQQWADMLGYEREELIGRLGSDFLFEEDLADDARQSRERRSGERGHYERRVRRKDGGTLWVLVSATPEMDERGEMRGVLALFADVTARKQALEQLRSTLHDTVRALGAVASLRDPYTGDHERRVAILADAIATEMDLDDERREGLRMAGEVHDVGKIGVPAEILSKPGRLTEVEFRLVAQHAARGHEILREIAFHLPVAEIVHQHHERLDGSGYPRGLRDDEILPEARILAVADVVEAMASHRPYRAALGLDAALGEIRDGAGTRYDAAVVAACERVLKAGIVRLDS